MKMRKSTQVAVGGLSSALCLLLMFMTGMIPFATFALPAMAGILLIAVVVENGYQTATMVYVAVSILSLFMCPDKEAPIIKGKLEKIKWKPLQYLVKFAVFNTAIVCSYWVIINLFGLTEILEEMGAFGKYTLLVTLGMGNLVFTTFDFALSRIMYAYVHILRKRIFRRAR